MLTVSGEMEEIFIWYLKEILTFWWKGSDTKVQLALYFSRHISTGVNFDDVVCVMVFGDVAEDPLNTSELSEFSNEHPDPRVHG